MRALSAPFLPPRSIDLIEQNGRWPATRCGCGDEQCFGRGHQQTGSRARCRCHRLNFVVLIAIAQADHSDLSLSAYGVEPPPLGINEQVIGIATQRPLRDPMSRSRIKDQQARWHARGDEQAMPCLVQGHGKIEQGWQDRPA